MAVPNKRDALEAHGNLLTVEGKSEVYSLPTLLESLGTHWPKDRSGEMPPVYIQNQTSKRGVARNLPVEWKNQTVKRMGIVIDADGDAEQAYATLYHAFLRLKADDGEAIPILPKSLAVDSRTDPGIICLCGDRRVGIWIMPDHQNPGMLEDLFLEMIAPDDTLLALARSNCQSARAQGAPFKEVHRHKAVLHTWRAWQDEPGKPVHALIGQRKMIPARSPCAVSFHTWFTQLFDLPPSQSTDPENP